MRICSRRAALHRLLVNNGLAQGLSVNGGSLVSPWSEMMHPPGESHAGKGNTLRKMAVAGLHVRFQLHQGNQ